MKLPKTHFTKLLWLGAIAGLVSQAPSSASTLYWTAKTSTGNDAAWDTSKTNWSATSPGVTGDVAFTNGADVIFSSPLANASGNTITLSGEVTPGSLTFRRESGASGVAFTINGGTLHMPTTITQSGGSNASGNVAINSSMVLSGNLTIEGNGSTRLTLGDTAGGISGTGDIILNNAGDFRVRRTNTFDGTFYLNSGQWVISNNNNRIVGTGPRTIHIGDGVGAEKSAVVALSGQSTAGLTAADSFTVKSDGLISMLGHFHNVAGNSGVGLIFDGGGAIGASDATAHTFRTSGVSVISGVAQSFNSTSTGTTKLELTDTAGFDVATGATFKLGSQYSKMTATLIKKTGGGTVEVTGALQTASSGFRIEEGAVTFKTGFTLPGTTSVDLAGGTLGAENIDLTLLGLTLSANSALDFGSVDGVDVLFTGGVSLGNYQLSISNFDSAAGDTLRFWDGSNVTITSEQAAQFQFGGGTHGAIDANGYISVVPEPSTYACLGLGMLLMSRFLRRSKA